MKPPPKTAASVPARFRVARRTLLLDAFMNRFIAIGGVAVILAVFGILVFITAQVIPLFSKATVRPLETHAIDTGAASILAVDEWSELPAVVTPDGRLFFHDLHGERGRFEVPAGLPGTTTVTAVRYRPIRQQLVMGTDDGRFATVNIGYTATFPDGTKRIVVPQVEASPLFELGAENAVRQIDYGDSGTNKLVVALVDGADGVEIHAATLRQRRSLLGAGTTSIDRRFELTGQVDGRPVHVAVPQAANAAVIATEAGEIFHFELTGAGFALRQRFTPFADRANARLAVMRFLLGDVSLVLVGANGENRVYSLYRDEAAGHRRFAQTKTFDDLPARPSGYFPSQRNKAFLITGGNFASLRYATTEDIRWEARLDFEPHAAALSSKYDRILILDTAGALHVYELDDPHPAAGLRSFFGRIWYEGQPAPDHTWQSTGGDDFEPKLSLVPLIYGSLKGTFYALFFSVPIALLAALYTSQFLKPEFKRFVKPVMEIMASVPSVVLGFLAALWLAPLIYDRVPSVLLVLFGVPAATCLFGWIWGRLPLRVRILVRPGWEFIAFLPVLVLCAIAAWNLGPALERLLFVVTDPETGARVADFRLWWPEVTGTSFNQRNSFVLGIMMGVAVIPIVFTISEDSMSNVPESLRSGSLALGASRWQTALRVVVPTAAAGIFSALMIGLGRAVGETMVVVMASGNTAIMSGNPFDGLRSLAANIAVELPEAPHNGTLYRTLFLSALVLFLMTFAVNTLAEILRQRLREKFRAAE